MNLKAILLHLRLPFSLFLMPVYWFALSQLPGFDASKASWIFVIWHLLVYPASNAYNSYFDKDEGSIGGLEKPPAVDVPLFWVAWVFDVLAILLAFFLLGSSFAIAVFAYGMVSKAYSHTAIRLKKYPIISWLVVGFFQGAFVYLSTQQALLGNEQTALMAWKHVFPALLSSLMLWAVYPITQIYQHEEDTKRGDQTLSILLGIRGTFVFTAFVFSVAFAGFYVYLGSDDFLMLGLCTFPTTVFFLNWAIKAWNKPQEANFKRTMWLNLLASAGLNIFYILLIIK